MRNCKIYPSSKLRLHLSLTHHLLNSTVIHSSALSWAMLAE